jgi:hypothetical protein
MDRIGSAPEVMDSSIVHLMEDGQLRNFKTELQVARRYHLFGGLLVSTISFSELVFWGCSDQLRRRQGPPPCHGATASGPYGI